MIQKNGDYYTFDEGPSSQSDIGNAKRSPDQESHEAVGNLK